jgi:cytochrome c553
MTSVTWLSAIVVLGALSCRPREEEQPPASTPEQPPMRAKHPPGPLEKVERAAAVNMPSHFADVLEIHSALISGATGDAQSAARELLAQRPPVMLEEWTPYVYGMEEAARHVAEADNLAAAASAASELVESCGRCHLALGVKLTMTVSDPPPAEGDAAAIMRRHKWAFDRLWEGLVLPSERAWSLGAAAFVDLPYCAQAPTAERDDDAVLRAHETLVGLEQTAREAKSWSARAGVYGQMLPTCSTCHAELDRCR